MKSVQTSEFRPAQIKPWMHFTNIWYLQYLCRLCYLKKSWKIRPPKFGFSHPRETSYKIWREILSSANLFSWMLMDSWNIILHIWGRGSGRTVRSGQTFLSAIAGQVGSGQCFAGSGTRKVTRRQLWSPLTVYPDFDSWYSHILCPIDWLLVLETGLYVHYYFFYSGPTSDNWRP